ncbi:hypothetical protein FB451DRAFT_1172009 [Mycena latifolia]|nr:hypothetical protein FB451DRAFT_1172009 [Mycena latifolia]
MASPAATTGLALLESSDTAGLLMLPPYARFDIPANAPSTPAFEQEEEREVFYLFNHWAINTLVPFLHRPSRFPRTKASYLAWVLDHCDVAFSAYNRFHSALPKTRLLGTFLAALEALVLQLPEEALDQPCPSHGTKRNAWILCLGEALQPFMVKDAHLLFNFQLPLFAQPKPFFVAKFRYAGAATESFKDFCSPNLLEELLPFLASRQDFQTAVMEKKEELLLTFHKAHGQLCATGCLYATSPRDFLPTGFRLPHAYEDFLWEEHQFPFPTLTSLNATPEHTELLREVGGFVAIRLPSALVSAVPSCRVSHTESTFYVELPSLKQVVESARASVLPVQTSGDQDIESEDATVPPPKERKHTVPVNTIASSSNAAAPSLWIAARRPTRKGTTNVNYTLCRSKKTTPTTSKTPPPARGCPEIVLFPDNTHSESIPGDSESHNELEDDEFEAPSSGSAKRKNKGKGKARPKKHHHVSEEAVTSVFPLDHKIGRCEATAKKPYQPSQAVPLPNVTGLLESLSECIRVPGRIFCMVVSLASSGAGNASCQNSCIPAVLARSTASHTARTLGRTLSTTNESTIWSRTHTLAITGIPSEVRTVYEAFLEDKTSEMMAPYLNNHKVVDSVHACFGIPGADNQQESKWVDFLLGHKERRDAMLTGAPLEPESEEVRQAILAGPSTSKGKGAGGFKHGHKLSPIFHYSLITLATILDYG